MRLTRDRRIEVSSSVMVLYVHRYPKGLLGTDEWRWGKREIIYLSLHFHHQNDSCVEMGRGESHFNVSIIVRDKVTRQCPQTTTFSKRRETETESSRDPSVYQPNALPLGQTGALKSSKIYQQRPPQLRIPQGRIEATRAVMGLYKN